jgi:hypothetical protein
MKQMYFKLIVILSAAFLSYTPLAAKSPKEPPPELLSKPSDKPSPTPSSDKKKPPSKDSKKKPPVEDASLAMGAWCAIGEAIQVKEKGAIAFNNQELADSTIVYSHNAFKLPHKGVYMVTYGVSTKREANMFQLQLSGKPVTGGKLLCTQDATFTYGTASLTVLLSAKAGDLLQVVNASGRSVQIGSQSDTVAAYISIVQIR